MVTTPGEAHAEAPPEISSGDVPTQNSQIMRESVAEGARLKNPTAPETIGPDLVTSVRSETYVARYAEQDRSSSSPASLLTNAVPASISFHLGRSVLIK